MATIRWYLVNGVNADGWQDLSTTAQGVATCNAGWVVGIGATFSSELQSNAERSAGFTANTVPDGTLDTTLKDAFVSARLNGTFAAANWTFQFAVVSTVQAGAADGQIVFRLIKATNPDGSGSPTEITSAQQSASVMTNVGATDINGTLTFNPGAFTINGHLFVQVAWKRTGAGGMSTTNIRLRTGSSSTVGTTILSADFTPAAQAVTGTTFVVSTPFIASDVFEQGIVNASSTMPRTAGARFGQSISGLAGALSSVSFSLSLGATAATDDHYIEIRDSTYTGTVLATSALVPAAGIATSPSKTWVTYTFTTPAILTASATYWIVWSRLGSSGDYVVWGSSTDVYARGINHFETTDYPNSDLGFRLYLPPAAVAFPPLGPITPPPVSSHIQVEYYDQSAIPDSCDHLAWDAALPATLFGQTFQAAARFSGIEVLLCNSTGGFVDGTLVMEVRAGSDPSGSLVSTGLMSAAQIHEANTTFPVNYRFYRFVFPTIDPGGSSTTYTWLVRRDGATGLSNPTHILYDYARSLAPVGNARHEWWDGEPTWISYAAETVFTRILSESVFSGTVANAPPPGPQDVTGTTLASSAALYAGTVATGAAAQSITGTTIGGIFDVLLEDGSFLLLEDGSSHLLYEPATMGTSQVFAGSVAVVAASQAVSGATIASTAALSPGSVTTLTSVSGATRASTASLFPGSVTTLTFVTGATRATTAIVNPGTVTTLTSVSGTTVPSTAQLFSGVVTTTTFVSGATIASGATLFPGRVSALVGGATLASTAATFPGSIAVNILGATLSSSATVFAGSLSPVGATLGPSATVFPGTALLGGTLGGATVPSSAQLFAGTVTAGPVTITGATITSSAVVTPGTVTTTTAVSGATRGSTATLFASSVTPGAVIITGATIASTVSLYPGQVTTGAVTILGSFIPSTATLYPGTVTPGAVTVSGATLLSSTTLYPGTIFIGIPVTGAIILSGSTLTPGLVTPGPVTVTGATLTAPSPLTHVFPGHVATATVICAVEFPIATDSLVTSP